MELSRLRDLLSYQQNILSKIALDDSFSDVFEDICLAIEELIEDKSAKCSILSLSQGKLLHCAAPSLDPQYSALVNGLEIGPEVGACGTAAYRETRVIVDNIDTSPLWKNYREVAQRFNLKSCWSTPITSTKTQVIGTFAIYHDHPKLPSAQDLELIDYFVHFSSIALEKKSHCLQLEALMNDLEHSRKKFTAFTKVMPDSALILSESGVYIDIYGSSDDLFSRSTAELLDKNVSEVLAKKDAEPIMAVIEKTLASDEIQVFEYELEVKKGKVTFEGRTAPIVYEQSGGGSQRHVLWMTRDITVRKEAENKVERLAYYDPLTNLPNRRLFTERLTQCIERIKRSNKTGALLFLDIDHFKSINDSFGHSVGDQFLVELAKRLSAIVRVSDYVS